MMQSMRDMFSMKYAVHRLQFLFKGLSLSAFIRPKIHTASITTSENETLISFN